MAPWAIVGPRLFKTVTGHPGGGFPEGPVTFVTSQGCTGSWEADITLTKTRFMPVVAKHGSECIRIGCGDEPTPPAATRETYRGHMAYVYCVALMEGL